MRKTLAESPVSNYYGMRNKLAKCHSLAFALPLLVSACWTAVHGQRKDAAQMDNHFGQIEESRGRSPKRVHAEAKITVRDSEAKPYDQTATPELVEINLAETFIGDIEGESSVRALQVRGNEHYATLVSLQRFRGKLSGREGSFVLQGSETVENGKIKASWFVVPGSGTGNLDGLRGEGGFQGDFGKASSGYLDYWFE
jgi:hypothetical protein